MILAHLCRASFLCSSLPLVQTEVLPAVAWLHRCLDLWTNHLVEKSSMPSLLDHDGHETFKKERIHVQHVYHRKS